MCGISATKSSRRKKESLVDMTMKWVKVMLLIMATGMTAHGLVTKTALGTTPDGTAVDLYILTSDGIEASIMTYGARVVSIKTPNRAGTMQNVVLGYGALDAYIADKKTYFGAIVGRYGNRIALGKFSIDGKQYQVPTNNNANSLHGGTVGFDQLVWQARAIADGVEMTLVSKDGDMGFPGTLTVHVRYTVHHNALRIDYSVSTDKATVVNLTNHSYFNLSADGKPILNEELMIPADQYTPVDAALIPTGVLAPVEGTPFDFRKATVIGARINDNNQQLKIAGGYDHNWVLRGKDGELKTAARVYDPVSGRVLTVTTTEPGVQFYSGNFLDETKYGKAQEGHQKNAGLCLETQHFPDSPNHPNFPSTLLKPGETRHSMTTFTFSTQAK